MYFLKLYDESHNVTLIVWHTLLLYFWPDQNRTMVC